MLYVSKCKNNYNQHMHIHQQQKKNKSINIATGVYTFPCIVNPYAYTTVIHQIAQNVEAIIPHTISINNYSCDTIIK